MMVLPPPAIPAKPERACRIATTGRSEMSAEIAVPRFADVPGLRNGRSGRIERGGHGL